MAYNWLKWFHGAVTDDKWPMVARKSGQPVAVVVAVWAALLECASQADDRGSIEDFDAESMDAVLQVEDGACAAIVDALTTGKRPRIADGRIVAWEKRQEEPQQPSSTERVRRFRERKKAHGAGDETTCGPSETPETTCNADETLNHVSCNADETLKRPDKTRLDKNINTTPPMDIFKYKDARVAQSVPVGGEGEEYLESAGVDENTPPLEFQEIRLAYNEHGRVEAPLAGLPEYLALKKSRQWPGQSAIYTAIDRLSKQDGPWLAGKAPGLAKFLKEQWWRMPPRTKARASPLTPSGQTVTERNAATAMQVLAEMEAENGN